MSTQPTNGALALEQPDEPWQFADAPLLEVSVNGAMIRYHLWDRAPPGAPTLLFLHGFRAHSRWWDHIVPFFWDDYKIVAMDFSGMGDSESRSTYTMRGFSDEVLAVIDDAGLAPATIIAHSFGGSPAALAGGQAPEKISHAILIDSRMIIEGVSDPKEEELLAFAAAKRLYPSLEALLERYRLIPVSGSVEPMLIDHISRHSARREGDGWTWKFDPAFDPQLTDDPDRLVPPSSLSIDYIFGEESGVVDRALANLIVSLFPHGAGPIVIPHCNHHVLLEQPLALVSVIRSLLARNEIQDNRQKMGVIDGI